MTVGLVIMACFCQSALKKGEFEGAPSRAP